MKICIVGAGGGIGSQLLKTFTEGNDVTPVYRSPESASRSRAGGAIAFSDGPALAGAVTAAQVVIHAALNTRLRGREFISGNRALTDKVLSLLPAACELFVYFSSQVVYSALKPMPDQVYSEGDPLMVDQKIDAYTKLKIDEERQVIQHCTARSIPYLILRPTVVMGPGMQWSTSIVSSMKYAPVGIGGRTVNLVHVEDLSRHVLSLVRQKISNTIFNVGDKDFSTEDYFAHAARLAGRRIRVVPKWIAATIAPLIPSTLWFLARDVRVACDKIKAVSDFVADRALGDYFPPRQSIVDGHTLDIIKQATKSNREFQTMGQGYSLWFKGPTQIDQLSMARYSGVISLRDNLVTVKAGTPISSVLTFLDANKLTIATLPEFIGVSAGACFFTEVHGSSSEHVALYDLIDGISYIGTDGVEHMSQQDLPLWENLRRQQHGVTVTEVTFRCVPEHLLSNVIEWKKDDVLEAYLHHEHRHNLSTTLHWFPHERELPVYNINAAEKAGKGDRSPFLPMRGLPYFVQRIVIRVRMRGRKRIVGKSFEILAPWKTVPARRFFNRVLLGLKSRVRNMEVCVEESFGEAFFKNFRANLADGTIELPPGQGIGIRFTAHHPTGRNFIWIETTSRDAEPLLALLAMTRQVCGEEFWFHRGKYVPEGVSQDQLLIPRLL